MVAVAPAAITVNALRANTGAFALDRTHTIAATRNGLDRLFRFVVPSFGISSTVVSCSQNKTPRKRCQKMWQRVQRDAPLGSARD